MMYKRIFDLFFSLVGLIMFFPLFLIISVSIKLDSRGGIFFIQARVGRNGDLFNIIKFRTMYVGQTNDSTISVRGDTRVTRLGSLLRRYKLDELPELWNVLIGEMSLVGPRPDVPGYADRLKGEDRDVLKLRPGITGKASLKYANEEDILLGESDPERYNDDVIFPDKVRINLEYYHNHSIWLDIKIIFATIFRRSY